MKKQAGLLLFFLILIFRGYSQESEPLHVIGLTIISQVNQGSSYINSRLILARYYFDVLGHITT